MPQAARTLGFEFVAFDEDSATIELAFTAPPAFTNPAGDVLGAFLAAMLYDTVGPALLATLEPDEFQETLDLHTTFLHPVRAGRVLATGRGHPPRRGTRRGLTDLPHRVTASHRPVPVGRGYWVWDVVSARWQPRPPVTASIAPHGPATHIGQK